MTGSSLRVLAYHRIVDPGTGPDGSPSLISATPAAFEGQLRYLARRYRVVSLDQVLQSQRGGPPLPRRAVLLTFDDGYWDFGANAWPILRSLGLPATVFVATGYPDRPDRRFWWDRLHQALAHTDRPALTVPGLGTLGIQGPEGRRAALSALQEHIKRIPHEPAMALVDRACRDLGAVEVQGPPVLGWDELRRLHDEGVTLAAHTRTHPALTQLGTDAVRSEVRGSIDDLADRIGAAPPAFCYPYGLFDHRSVDAARREGVELAFTCLDGHNRSPSADPLRMRRTSITPRTSSLVFPLRLLRAVTYVDMWRHRPKPATRRATIAADSAPGASPADGPAHSPASEPANGAGLRVAYIMSRFPKLSETFILNEILGLEARGVPVEVFPLLRERQPVSHPEALRLAGRARYLPFLSPSILRAQIHCLRRRPGAYVRALFEVLRGTWGSANFFFGALGIFPKSVRFAYEMERLGITRVHAHFCSHPAVAALIIHRLTGIPFSFTAHGSDLHVERRMLDRKLEAADFAITVCDFNREVMVEECGEDLRSKIHVVHCGVDVDRFRAVTERTDGRPVEIVTVASLEAVKGHRFLVEACRLLRDRGVDFRCHVVGAGPLRTVLEDQIQRHGLGGRFHLLGGQPAEEVARLLTTMDIAVLASHPTPEGKREGVPVALMEAMASGLPVVASGISGIPELVDDGVTGLLVPSGDPVALADALERLSADPPLRRRMGAAGRDKVVREFSLDANVRDVLQLLAGEAEPEDRSGVPAATSPGADTSLRAVGPGSPDGDAAGADPAALAVR